MYSLKSHGFKLLIAIMAIASFMSVRGVYVTTPRDTAPAPDVLVYLDEEPGGQAVYENTNFKYWIDEERDIIHVYDKRNGYTWKTGLDIPFNSVIKDACKDIEGDFEDQFKAVEIDTEDPLLDKYEEIFTTKIGPLENADLFTYSGVLEVRSRDLAAEYDDGAGNMTPATKEDLQIYFEGLELVAGTTYQVSYQINSNGVRDFELMVGSEYAEVITSLAQTNSDMIEVTYTFTQSITENDAQLLFNFGYFDTSVDMDVRFRIDNVKIEEIDGTVVVPDTDQIVVGHFDIPEEKYDVTVDELLEVCIPLEERMNETYTAFANSLVSIEYFNSKNSPFYASSGMFNEEGKAEVVQSNFGMIEDDGSEWVLEVNFIDQEIELKLYISFTESGIEYDLYNDDITGAGTEYLAGVIIAPFQGAGGGAKEAYDASNVYDIEWSDEIVFNDPIPGYVLVPEGSGTLVRFNDYNIKLNKLRIDTYGMNPTQNYFFRSASSEFIPFKTLSLPLFGISHGNNQAGFVAYATSGDEYMTLEIWPEEHITYYTNAFARFNYNATYFQIYNRAGEGNLQLQDERNNFDIHLVYEYLDGTSTEGERADYVGMALKYREYLFGEEHATYDYEDIPIRLDFLMSDSEKSLIGFQNQVTTTTDGVDRILDDILDKGITNINSGLLGWNDGGISLGDPRDTDFSSDIGRKRDFEDLIDNYQDLGVDISLSQNYFLINEEIMRYQGNAAKHTTGWYATKFIWDYNLEQIYYASPKKSIEWMLDQTDEIDDLGVDSYTVDGITNNLISDFNIDMWRNDAKEYIVNGFSKLDSDVLLNAYQPNAYLLEYVDRYLQAPVYGTQYLIETDTVPFLQLVLQGQMEVYGPYANFSFYTEADMLRMIDYNVYPSFVLTEQPAYLLTDTLSRNFYSTEYTLYEELIQELYTEVNDALRYTINYSWVNREVIIPGVIVNTYENGTNTVQIIINYTEDPFEYNGETVEPVSYMVD